MKNRNIYPNIMLDGNIILGSVIMFTGHIYDDADNGKYKLKDYIRLSGWLEANGQLLSKSDYPELYEVIGDIYNCDNTDSSLFRIPDLRSMFIRGVQNEPRENNNRSSLDDPDASEKKRLDYITLKTNSSDSKEQIGTIEKNEFSEHTHEVGNLIPATNGPSPSQGMLISTTGGSIGQTTPTGETGYKETRPNNIALYYLIKVSYNTLK
ncbi:MAG: phage tail protein [Hyphomicrobiales bacterium]